MQMKLGELAWIYSYWYKGLLKPKLELICRLFSLLIYVASYALQLNSAWRHQEWNTIKIKYLCNFKSCHRKHLGNCREICILVHIHLQFALCEIIFRGLHHCINDWKYRTMPKLSKNMVTGFVCKWFQNSVYRQKSITLENVGNHCSVYQSKFMSMIMSLMLIK